MTKELTFKVEPEGDIFVAQCLDVDIASDGLTREEAIANLQEAMTLHFEYVDFQLVEVKQH